MYMMTEAFQGYLIEASPIRNSKKRWGIAAIIKKTGQNNIKENKFYADDGITYILEIEAAKECINFSKNLIKKGLVGF
jgi:hypothetical protein